MNDSYRVSFYKDSDGHSFKNLQRQIDIRADSPSQALVLAEREIDNERLNADCIEVMHLAHSDHDTGSLSAHSPTPCKQTWSRVP